LKYIRKEAFSRKELITVVILFISIGYMLLWKEGNHIKMISLNEMRSMAEFYPGGRKPVFFPDFYSKWTNVESGLYVGDFSTLVLIAVTFIILLVLRRKALVIPQIFWNVFFASTVLFILSSIFMYKLHGPSRYFGRYSVPLILIFFVVLNFNKLLDKIKSVFSRKVVFFICLALIPFTFIPKLQRHYIVAPYPSLYNFLSKLPKDILIACHPNIADNIPIFAQRAVLVNEETATPEHLNLYPFLKERIYDFFNAYYSSSQNGIREFCKKYNISQLIIDKKHFSPDYLKKGKFYLEPFNDYIKNLVKNRDSFVLMSIPEEKKVFKEGDIFVLTVKDVFGEN